MNTDFGPFIHINAQSHAVGQGRISHLYDVHFRIEITFIDEELAHLSPRIVQQSIGYHLASNQGNLLREVFRLALANPGEGKF